LISKWISKSIMVVLAFLLLLFSIIVNAEVIKNFSKFILPEAIRVYELVVAFALNQTRCQAKSELERKRPGI
jgi:hypothetical protein